MSFKCKIGLHSWDGCKCTECGKIRDEYHNWLNDCDKCSNCGKIRDDFHYWGDDCNKCSKCGKIKEIQHDWSQDCEKCSNCRKTIVYQHDWSIDCEKCSKCGKTRDNQHDYSKDCEKCSKCSKSRENQHNWIEDCDKCSKCDRTRKNQHNWVDCKCSKCGKTSDEKHEWSKEDCETCAKCGITYRTTCPVCDTKLITWESRYYCNRCKVYFEKFIPSQKKFRPSHDWNGCRCSKCGKIRDEQHDWDYDNCSKCAKTRELVTFERNENRPHPAASHIKITKRIYKSQSKEAALSFLEKQNVTEPFYYIEIDTPSGRFGIDNGGRIYDNNGQFIEPEAKPIGVTYDKETTDMKAMLEKAMQNKERQLPKNLMENKESVLHCLQVIIEDASADFYLRRMAIWWGSQFKDDAFNTFLKKRFVDGKDRVSLYQKAESSQSEVARAEEGLHIASVDVLSGSWKP